MWFLYDFGTSTVVVKLLLWIGIPEDYQILAPVYSLFLAVGIENPYIIACIEAPLKSAVWRSKFVIFQNCGTFLKIFLSGCVELAVLVHLHHVW